MPIYALDEENALYYEHLPPQDSRGHTFTFFNALTGDVEMWSAGIVPALREAGHGALVYNMRGQREAPFAQGLELTARLIVADALRLLAEVRPVRPVLVGLSIGGLFAAQAILEGAEADGLVLINTLRADGPRLRWINDAMVRCVEVGGPELMRDLFFPLLFNEQWLGENRGNFLGGGAYAPLDSASGTYKLLSGGRTADWNLPYEKLTLPVLVVSGLQDHVFYDREVVADLTARMPNAQTLDVPDAGHLLPTERPQALIEALLEFGRKLWG